MPLSATLPNTAYPPQGNVLLNAHTREPISLAMQHLHMAGQASPAGALLRSTHRFKCAGNKPMEALYVFMLPRNGTLRRFIVKGEGFEVESKLEPRKEAREEYEQGVADGHLSVQAESSPDGMVTLSVGQVRPGEEIIVIVETVSGVDVKDDSFRFRYPFTLAPSYHAQAKVTSSDNGGRIDLPDDVFGDLILPEWKTGQDGLHQISFEMRVSPGGKLGKVSSPSHRISVSPNEDGSATVEMAADTEIPNRDLVIEVQAQEAFPTLLVDDKVDKSLPKKAPTWTAIIPSSLIPRAQDAPRRVCFLLDTSGSMQGLPLERAKAALDAMLAGLDPKDEFGLVQFNSIVDSFDKRMATATDVNRERARAWLAGICATGGTSLALGLGEAVDVLGGPGGDIFLMTDGEVWETGPIIEQAAASGSRIHILGIGSASQDRFLSTLARRTGGVCEMVGAREDVAGSSLKLFAAVRQPIQVDVEAVISFGGKKKAQTQTVGTVWENKAVIITDDGTTGRNRPKSILFKYADGETPVDIKQIFETPSGLSALLWAGRQIEDLDSQMDIGRDGPVRKAAERDMKQISSAYGLASRAMSLVAVVDRIGDQVGDGMDQKVVPVGMPEDMNPAGVFGSSGVHVMSRSLDPSGSRGISGNSAYPSGGFDFYTSCSTAPQTRRSPLYSSRGVTGQSLISDCETYSSGNIRVLTDAEARSRRPGMYKGGKISEPVRGIGFGDSLAELTPSDLGMSILDHVAKLKGDGGYDGGNTPEERRTLTTLLALACRVSDEGAAALYTSHLRRMKTFLAKKGENVFVADTRKTGSSSQDWVGLLNDVLSGDVSYADADKRIQSALA